jgi:hypothetical protein
MKKKFDPVVTKSILKFELKKVNKKIDQETMGVEMRLEMRMDTMEERIETNAQKRHNEIMSLFDGLASEVKNSRDFRTISGQQISRNSQKIEDLETKVFGSIQN